VSIVRTARARASVLESFEYIDERSPRAAERFLDAVEATYELIHTHPGIGGAYQTDNPALDGLRRLTVKRFAKYLVFYQVRGADIVVLDVLHGSRDIQRILESAE
jgi:toxin ParE1/3/4